MTNLKKSTIISCATLILLLSLGTAKSVLATSRDFYDFSNTPAKTYANANYTSNANSLNELISKISDPLS